MSYSLTMGDEQTIGATDQFRQLIDTNPVMVCLLDKKFNGLYFNQEWLSFTGRAEWDLLGNQWLSCIHPLDRDRCIKVFRESLANHGRYEMDFRIQRPDGCFSNVRNTGVPQISENGPPEEYISMAVDVTACEAVEALRQEFSCKRPRKRGYIQSRFASTRKRIA